MLNAVVDGGRISDPQHPECRQGSTVVDLSKKGFFQVLRRGRCVIDMELCMYDGKMTCDDGGPCDITDKTKIEQIPLCRMDDP